jgi:cytochrome b561
MTTAMADEDLYKIARKRVRDRRDFLQHLAIYVIVNAILALAWAFGTDIDHPWFIWVLIPWGIGLLIHFIMLVLFSGRDMKIEEKSARQGDRKKGFYLHLALYVIVNIILIVAWARTGAESHPVPWFVFPLVGWGIFVVWNYFEAFVWPEETGWEKRQTEKEFEKLKKRTG